MDPCGVLKFSKYVFWTLALFVVCGYIGKGLYEIDSTSDVNSELRKSSFYTPNAIFFVSAIVIPLAAFFVIAVIRWIALVFKRWCFTEYKYTPTFSDLPPQIEML
jgi:hypothetical protein